MALLSPAIGNVLLLRYLLNNAQPGNVELRLYANDQTPAETDTLANYTEVSASGYTAVALSGAGWTIAAGPVSGSTATYAAQNFSISAGPVTSYGYFVRV